MKLRHQPDRVKRPGRLRAALFSLGAIGLVAAVTMTAASAQGTAPSSHQHHARSVHVDVLTPSRHGLAGAGGAFNVDVSLSARHDETGPLSGAAGYIPFLNLPPASTFGPGLPDPGAPGLVVLLSTTPAAAGGPNANLAGVFQLNAVEQAHGRDKTFNDWEVGSPGFFGVNVDAVLTVFVVDGTAPGVVDLSQVHPISNVVQIPFHIA
jgi:hypothetical protein